MLSTCGDSEVAEDPWLTMNPRSWTIEEKTSALYFIAGQTFDTFTTERGLDNPDVRETNIIMGSRPSDETVIVYFSLTGIATVILAHFSPKIRKYLLFSGGTLGMTMGFRNQELY